MSQAKVRLEPRMKAAVAEMKDRVLSHFPTATFRLDRSDEDPTIVHLVTIVDIDDPDEVTDLVIDRMGELLINEDLPLFVIPIHTPERVAALLEAMRADRAHA